MKCSAEVTRSSPVVAHLPWMQFPILRAEFREGGEKLYRRLYS